MDEVALVKASQAGDKTAFGMLIDRYYKNIYQYAYQCMGNHQDSDDICQETFFRAFDNIRMLKDAKKFKGWIFKIASNLSRKRIKNIRVEKNILTTACVDSLIQRSEDNGTQPFENLSGRENAIMIQEELQKMPEHIRMATVLVLIEGQTQKETAEILNCSESTISRDLDIGRAWLRKRLRNLF